MKFWMRNRLIRSNNEILINKIKIVLNKERFDWCILVLKTSFDVVLFFKNTFDLTMAYFLNPYI
jgi:hypothetical protein